MHASIWALCYYYQLNRCYYSVSGTKNSTTGSIKIVYFPGSPIVNISNHSLSQHADRVVNVTVSWILSGGDSVDFYLINIITNAPQTPYGGLLNITTASVTLTAFIAGYEYNISVRGVNCGSQEGRESEPLTIRPQGMKSLQITVEIFYYYTGETTPQDFP